MDTSGRSVGQIRGPRRSDAAARVDEARWRQLFGNSIVGISVIDSDFHFTDASPTFQQMVGYSVEELRRVTPLDISIEEERELNKTLFLELRQGRRQNYQIVKRLRRKDGEVIWVSIYAFAVHGTYASEDMHIALVIDITENKKAEQALIAAQSELLRLSQLTTMGTMTASIAHEISQPLAAITTHGHAGLRWLSRVAPDIAEASVALRRIVENAERLSTIINGIRAMFKTDSAERTNIRINDVLLEVLSFADMELHQSKVLVQSDLFHDLPALRADRVQLQQVFFNLISNAIEAMRSISNRPRVLTIKSEMNPPDSVVITFADTGIGIEPKDLDRIFAPFVTTKASGMGMGLAICRSILEAHGGRIWVTAADPCGSVFHVRLPITTP